LEAWKVQLSYDVTRNIAYLRLRESVDVQVETVRLSDEVNVDLARTEPSTASSFSTLTLSFVPPMVDALSLSTKSPVNGSRFPYRTSPDFDIGFLRCRCRRPT